MADVEMAPPPVENGVGATENGGVGTKAIVATGEVRTPAPSLPAPDLSDLKLKPATQTKAIGIIHPPPDIRAIVDKTAEFVARNGEGRRWRWRRKEGDLAGWMGGPNDQSARPEKKEQKAKMGT